MIYNIVRSIDYMVNVNYFLINYILVKQKLEIIKRMIKKMRSIRSTTTTNMMRNTDMNTLMIMTTNTETNMHHMKKNK